MEKTKQGWKEKKSWADPGALSAGEPERKAALLESVNDANRLSHSANVEEEPLPPEDVKPSCSTDCTANQLHSSEIHTFQEQQRLESVDSAKQEVVTCGTEPVLTETQRYFRLQNCASLLERSCKESLLSRMVTFGERWILYDMEEQTARCVNEMELPKKLEPHQRKLLVAVWWTASGAVHHAFHRNCDAINEDWYCGEIVSMHKKLLLQQRAMRNKFNEYLRHQVLSNVKDVEDAFQRFLETKTDAFFSAGINKLVPRWKKCLEVNGNYFDE
ncbi:hypothetical protein ANCCEY_12364 [Ancylostoma ceylanicum]|uniref:Uncharacterized protein n=1 Tax=Ancylostoma ceylanicum TaxID=53326 RepID=A0A0D6LF45_9BILA|nr:hypothetical protein ANCCEY_12364 [Ancylostoma ceylanicum]